MTASGRGLAVLIALALALGILVVLDDPPSPATIDRALVVGLDPGAIRELAWTYPDGTRLAVKRGTATEPWTWAAPAAAPLEPSRLDAVLTALRGGRWHRRRPTALPLPGATALAITVADGGAPTVLQLAAPGSGQAWIARADRTGADTVLVDDWVVRALAPEPLALRDRTPLDDARSATRFVIERLEPPLTIELDDRMRRTDAATSTYHVRPALAAALTEALSAITIATVPVRAPVQPVVLAITLELAAPERIALHGACTATDCECPPAMLAITGTAGAGCIPAAQVAALAAAIDAFAAPALALANPTPVPFAPAVITSDAASLRLTRQPVLQLGPLTAPADPAQLAELVAALRTPGTPVARPSGPPRATRSIEGEAAVAVRLSLYAGNIVARDDEPLGIRIAPAAFALVLQGLAALRDPTLWLEEPLAVRAVTVRDGASDGRQQTPRAMTFTRGAVLGEWLVDNRPVPAARAQLVDALVQALARPQAIAQVRGASQRRHQLVLELAPFGGTASPTLRSVEVGMPTAAGCPLRSDVSDAALVARQLCDLVQQLLPLH